MPECNQQGCELPGAFRFTWPGEDEAFICVYHQGTAETVAEAMGCHVQFISLEESDAS